MMWSSQGQIGLYNKPGIAKENSAILLSSSGSYGMKAPQDIDTVLEKIQPKIPRAYSMIFIHPTPILTYVIQFFFQVTVLVDTFIMSHILFKKKKRKRKKLL